MRKLVVGAIAAAALTATAVALAAQPTPTPVTFKTTMTATAGKGSKSKPVPVGATYAYTATTSDGSRPETAKQLEHAWEGIRNNGKYFPVCTAAMIEAKQSTSVCPKGSLVATGSIEAHIGPSNDFSGQGATCKKKTLLFNAGQDKATSILVGPGSDCVGVNYSSPETINWVKAGGIGGGQNLVTKVAYNVTHPLPGVLASTVKTIITFPKLTVTVKGVKHGYLESIGCRGKRDAVQTIIGDPSGRKYTDKLAQSSC